MLIGLTYDLRADYLAAGYREEETAEFDRPATIEAIEAALRELGHQTDRIGNGRQLVERLAAGDRWDLVFNIAEGLHGLAREAQVPAILDLYEIPYTFSDPLVLAVCLHKGLTKTVSARPGVPTRRFALVERIEDVEPSTFPFRCLPSRWPKGPARASRPTRRSPTAMRSGRVCARAAGPLPAAGAGRDLPPGPRVHRRHPGHRRRGPGARQHGNHPPAGGRGRGLFLREQGAVRGILPLPAPPRSGRPGSGRRPSESPWPPIGRLGCRDAGRVDIRCDGQGRPHFMEVNPLAGLHPKDSDLPIICGFFGMTYRELIEQIVAAASCRVTKTTGSSGKRCECPSRVV